ncbi:MAG TPA: hypothetical protein VEN81_10385, partial [Planctomycetota bacterium]|nr:hypothetical protein [Planctomycetota bacterium]
VGTTTILGDLTVTPGGDDEPALPAWTSDGRSIGYLLRHSLINRLQFGGTVAFHVIHEDGSGDLAIAEPTGPSIVAGPVFQGGTAWLKTSDGRILRVDLDTRGISASIDAGIGVPDALALSPDGGTLATFRLEEPGRLGILVLRSGKAETVASLAEKDGWPHALDFSPDGETLLMDRREGPRSDLWTLRIATGAWTRLTSDGGSSDPVWHGR